MRRVARTTVLTAVVALLATAPAWATKQPLPADGSSIVTDHGANDVGIASGSTTAGAPMVPWVAVTKSSSGQAQLQVRSYQNGAWVTQGSGTVNGLGQTTFPDSLNFDQTQDAQGPSIAFAGANRTQPWTSWYESNSALGGTAQIFVSTFDPTQGKWIFAGQSRGAALVKPPSLNLDTAKDAQDPTITAGATIAGAASLPWVTWSEQADSPPGTGVFQVIASKGFKNVADTCPVGTTPVGGQSLHSTCWQQVGAERNGTEVSLNVDRARPGLEPAMAWSGPSDAVPWITWYESGTGTAGHLMRSAVFAAKAVAGAGDGGFTWRVVGKSGSGTLDATTDGSPCMLNITAEGDCSIASNGTDDDTAPRIASGTMTPGTSTVPWIAFQGGTSSVYVSRLVGGDHFELANGGQPITSSGTTPDITFDGNTPYVSWRDGTTVKSGHFTDVAHFVVDGAGVGDSPADLAPPISSACAATPESQDGSACVGGAIGTPVQLYINGAPGSQKLLANAYAPGAVTTSAATAVAATSATLNGALDTGGAALRVHFDYGASMTYGSSTPVQNIAASSAPTAVTAPLAGLAAGQTVHYRLVATTDFTAVNGADQTFTTPAPFVAPPAQFTVKVTKETLNALLKAGTLGVVITPSLKSYAPGTFSVGGSTTVTVKKKKVVRPLFTVRKVGIGKGKPIKVSLKLTKAGRTLLTSKTRVTITVRVTAALEHHAKTVKTAAATLVKKPTAVHQLVRYV